MKLESKCTINEEEKKNSLHTRKSVSSQNFSQIFVIIVIWQSVIGVKKNGTSTCK